MKKWIILIFLGFVSFNVLAQINSPIKWTFSSKKTGSDIYEIHATAVINKGWHTYSQSTPKGGPIPTLFTFTKNPFVTFVGAVKEVGDIEKHDEPMFGVVVRQFSDKVDFIQIVKVKVGIKTNFAGSVDYMLCNNKECLPPCTQNFSVSLN